MESCSCRDLPDTFEWDPRYPLLGGNVDEVDATPSLRLLACRTCGQLWRLELPPVLEPRAIRIHVRQGWSSLPVAERVEATLAPGRRDRLPVFMIVSEAFSRSWALRGELLKAAALPFLATVVVRTILEAGAESTSFAFRITVEVLTSALILSFFAVPWHRRILLGESVSWRAPFTWTPRHPRFVLWALGIALLQAPVLLRGEDPNDVALFFMVLAAAAVLYITVRISVALPATAVGETISLRSAWELTAPAGWRLIGIGFLILLWVLLLLGVCLMLLALAGIGPEPGGPTSAVLWEGAWFVVTAVDVSALSLSYRWLRDYRERNA